MNTPENDTPFSPQPEDPPAFAAGRSGQVRTPTPSHTPTAIPASYADQLTTLLTGVQHLQIGVPNACDVILKMMDGAVIAALQDYIASEAAEAAKPRIIRVS